MSASLNDCFKGKLPINCKILSFDITIVVSAYFFKFSKPFIAFCIRVLPSKVKGLVTMPTTKAFSSLAIFATIGAAPVPVPPPIPAAMKTMSAPLIISLISFSDAIAAASPISGLAPAPSPLVKPFPKTSLFSTFEQPRI